MLLSTKWTQELTDVQINGQPVFLNVWIYYAGVVPGLQIAQVIPAGSCPLGHSRCLPSVPLAWKHHLQMSFLGTHVPCNCMGHDNCNQYIGQCHQHDLLLVHTCSGVCKLYPFPDICQGRLWAATGFEIICLRKGQGEVVLIDGFRHLQIK